MISEMLHIVAAALLFFVFGEIIAGELLLNNIFHQCHDYLSSILCGDTKIYFERGSCIVMAFCSLTFAGMCF